MTPWFLNISNQQPLNPGATPSKCHFQVRAAIGDDLKGVADIIADSFHSPNGLWGWAFPILRLGIYEDLRHRLASPPPHHICLVATDTSLSTSDNLVGTVELGVRFSDAWTKSAYSVPYLSNLAIHPKYRRQGAASNLLSGCEKQALEWGFKDIYLHVLENNHQARQLYFKMGYRVHKVENSLNTLIFRRSRQILLHKHLSANPIL